MKKLIVIALAVIMALSMLVVLAACGGEKYDGECHYANKWGGEGAKDYGVKVTVTVKDGKIADVKLWTDEQTGWVRTSADNKDAGWEAYDETEAAYKPWIKKEIIGKTVEEVMAWTATATVEGQDVGNGPTIVWGNKEAGETAKQSAARIIVAIQDALSKIPAAE